MADEVRITPNLPARAEEAGGSAVAQAGATGEEVQVTELPPDQKGSYRIGSATDPDATYRVHGEDKVDFGYNVSVAATKNFAREIGPGKLCLADTGAQPDPVAIPDLLTAQSEHHDLTPAKLIYDAAACLRLPVPRQTGATHRQAGTGKTYARVHAATEGQTRLVSPLISHEKPTGRFGPEDFMLSGDGATLTCPNGQVSDTAYRSGSGDGRNFRFFAHQCAGCPFWDHCRDPDANPHGKHQVFISDHRPHVEADMKLRPLIERIIAALTRYNGARRVRSRGTPKADFQAKMNATAANVKRWLRLPACPGTADRQDLRASLATKPAPDQR